MPLFFVSKCMNVTTHGKNTGYGAQIVSKVNRLRTLVLEMGGSRRAPHMAIRAGIWNLERWSAATRKCVFCHSYQARLVSCINLIRLLF